MFAASPAHGCLDCSEAAEGIAAAGTSIWGSCSRPGLVVRAASGPECGVATDGASAAAALQATQAETQEDSHGKTIAMGDSSLFKSATILVRASVRCSTFAAVSS